MAKHSQVAQGYAESLYGMARLEGVTDLLEDQLFELNKGISRGFELREFLADAAVPAAEKRQALNEILTEAASPLLRFQLDLLIDMGKAGLISEVAEAYIALVEEEKNRVLAEVTSAIPLTPELTERLAEELNKATGKNVSVKNVVDTDVLGGLVIKMEDKIIDLSLRRKLDDLRNNLRASLS